MCVLVGSAGSATEMRMLLSRMNVDTISPMNSTLLNMVLLSNTEHNTMHQPRLDSDVFFPCVFPLLLFKVLLVQPAECHGIPTNDNSDAAHLHICLHTTGDLFVPPIQYTGLNFDTYY